MLDVERNRRGRWRAAEAAISVAAVAAVGGDTRLAMTLCSRISPTVSPRFSHPALFAFP